MSLKILFCSDGSSFSEAACRVALQLAKAHPDAVLTVMHVVNVKRAAKNILQDLPGRLGFEPAVVSEEVERTYKQRGEEILSEVVRDAELLGLSVTTLIETGAVAERISYHSRHADIVIVGMRGTTEDSHPGQGGGNLDQLLHSVTAPVLFVGRGHQKVDSIGLGYDGSEGAAHALKAAGMLAAALKVPLHTIFIATEGASGAVLDECNEHYPDHDIQQHVVVDDDPHTAIARVAEANGANVIAVGFTGRSKLRDFLYGTAADYILINTKLMVLVAH
ncbi:MAG: nucleotide-binding universal stress UspA family protein [Kiritimatiellia bacterium]|jgi:nucleotide-binding universal stress UspA family protein